MKRIPTLGIFAPVDAGKTSLSEALLFLSGAKRTLGRVDHGDTLMDSNPLEQKRGITIFSGVASLPLKTSDSSFSVTFIDTPGHRDFAEEWERVLPVLDYALLVLPAPEGPSRQVQQLFSLLRARKIPVFLFCNKMDLLTTSQPSLLSSLKQVLSKDIYPFALEETTAPCMLGDPLSEFLGEREEAFCDAYLEEKADSSMRNACLFSAFSQGKLFPVFFGSALQTESCQECFSSLGFFLEGMAKEVSSHPSVKAKVFRILPRKNQSPLVLLRILQGSLHPKDLLSQEKVQELFSLQGDHLTPLSVGREGEVVAVSGLHSPVAGSLLTPEASIPPASFLSPPMLRITLEEAEGKMDLLQKQLEELYREDPSLSLTALSQGNFSVSIHGPLQEEILLSLLEEGGMLQVTSSPPKVILKETLTAPVLGIGHYEPLKHYAECQLLLSPGAPGSGITFSSRLSTDLLGANYQHLIETHVKECRFPGTLTGNDLTDVQVTLVAGRAHEKHTQGGDFRQAVYRAILQGLMLAKAQGNLCLLEPWCSISLEVPREFYSAVYGDLQGFGCLLENPILTEDVLSLTGKGPYEALKDYPRLFPGRCKGSGTLFLEPLGWEKALHPEEYLFASSYDPLRNLAFPPSSIFCSHGAGFEVPWEEVPKHAHCS